MKKRLGCSYEKIPPLYRYAEALNGVRTMINRAYFVMVGTDENQKPVEVPGLIVEGVTQEIEWEAGKKRAQLRKVRRNEGF